MALAFKSLVEMSPDELVEYQRSGKIPEVDPEHDAAMRKAGWDPVTHRPLDVAEEKRQAKRERERAAEIERFDDMSVEEAHAELERMKRKQAVGPHALPEDSEGNDD